MIAHPLPAEAPADATLTRSNLPSPTPIDLARAKPRGLPACGDRVGDFEILSLLGEGGFARVFLARQISLDRQVALKASANRGDEARTLASLEHDHIVRVFSETVDPARDLRLLCMQYVPGTTLGRVIDALSRIDRDQLSGRALLEAIDGLSTQRGMFDPAALRDRDLLSQADFIQAVCWIGARLAEALAYAHGQGVLHRDIKPANILITPYGRPMLADFNLSSVTPRDCSEQRSAIFGGTVAYMAPEHLDAFNPAGPASSERVDSRSDLYSLGVVLFQLLAGERPYRSVSLEGEPTDALLAMAAERRAGARSPRQCAPDVPEVLDRIVRRCLAPRPEDRYQTAAELARALTAAGELRRIERLLPRTDGRMARLGRLHPLAALLVLTITPNVLGTLVNISYNAQRIVSALAPVQQRGFGYVVLLYNLLVYPLCVYLFCRYANEPLRALAALDNGTPIDGSRLAQARQRLLKVPLAGVAVSCVGWLPGALVFPLALELWAPPLPAPVWGHFLLSFWISGLISATYTFFGLQDFSLRALYPLLSFDACDLQRAAPKELRAIERHLHLFELTAVAIPLVSAAMMAAFGPQAMSRSFRLLVTAMIVLGMAGFGLAIAITRRCQQVLVAFTGARSRREPTRSAC